MKKKFTRFEKVALVWLAGLIGLCSFDRPDAFTQKDFEKLQPLVGTWVTSRPKGDIYETWQRKSATELAGMSYMIQKSDTIPLETVRLFIQDQRIVYAPLTAGQNQSEEVPFTLKAIEGKGRFVFENLQHDFPQRIVYDFQSANALLAYIEGNQEGKRARIDYPYKRVH